MTSSTVARPVVASRPTLRAETVVVASLVLAKLGMHLALATQYGRHRDEYYFIDCGRHLAFGYVDHAPLVPWLAGLSTPLFGDSLLMLRLPAIVAGAVIVWLTVLLSRRFGANLFGQALSGMAVLLAPAFLRMHGMLDIPAFEPLFWTVAALLLVDLIDGADKKRWLFIGVVVGVGLLNKHTMLLWGVGVAVGVLATPLRSHLRTRWPWLGAAVALLIFSPNLVWQAQHGWPTVEFIVGMGDTVLANIPRPMFWAGQVLYFGLFALPIWLCSLAYFASEAGRRYRLFGYLFVTVLVVLTITRGKPYYAAPAYPMAFAAGAAWLGDWFSTRPGLRAAFTTAFVTTSVALAAVTLPIFPLATVDAVFETTLGWAIRPVDLTHDMHDELGWSEQTEVVAGVFEQLPPEERATATIFANSYGQASALNFHGEKASLPRANSGHMTHYLWGPDPTRNHPLIMVGSTDKQRALLCESPEEVARITHPEAMDDDVRVHLCRHPKPLNSVWRALKRYAHGRAKDD